MELSGKPTLRWEAPGWLKVITKNGDQSARVRGGILLMGKTADLDLS